MNTEAIKSAREKIQRVAATLTVLHEDKEPIIAATISAAALAVSEDIDGALDSLNEALSALSASAEQQPLTDSYVQIVPDKCDRIVWRNAYYHLPIAPQASQPTLSHTAYLVLTAVAEDANEPKHRRDAACEALKAQASQPVALTDEQKDAIYNAWRAKGDSVSYGDLIDDVERALLSATSQPSEAEIRREAMEEAAKVIELYDDATMAADNHMLDSTECAEIIRALAQSQEQQAPAQTGEK